MNRGASASRSESGIRIRESGTAGCAGQFLQALRLRLLIPAFALFFLFCPSTPGPKDATELIPADSEISGWTRSGAMDVCNNATELLALIDGEGQDYIDHGFAKSAFQTFQGTVGSAAVDLYLRVFDMGDSTNARDIYAEVAVGTEQPWNGGPGDAARTDESGFASYAVQFRQENFYVSVVIMDKTTAGQDIAKLFAQSISATIEE
jgi:hypothetical protein